MGTYDHVAMNTLQLDCRGAFPASLGSWEPLQSKDARPWYLGGRPLMQYLILSIAATKSLVGNRTVGTRAGTCCQTPRATAPTPELLLVCPENWNYMFAALMVGQNEILYFQKNTFMSQISFFSDLLNYF